VKQRVYRALLSIRRALLSISRALFNMYRAHLIDCVYRGARIYRALLNVHTGAHTGGRAKRSVHRALFSIQRALLNLYTGLF